MGTAWRPRMRKTPSGRGGGEAPNPEAREPTWELGRGRSYLSSPVVGNAACFFLSERARRRQLSSTLHPCVGSLGANCGVGYCSRGRSRGHRVPGGSCAMALLSTIRGATWGRLVTRHFSHAARRGERPGGEELSRLLLDDLVPTSRLELLFGLSPCLLALRAARRSVARLLLQAGKAGLQGERAELLRMAEARDIPVLRPRRQKLDTMCRYQVHQGVCMEVSPLRPRPWSEAGEASPGDDPQQLWLVLEGIQDPRNFGAVLRSAHFLGVDKVITSRRNRHGRPSFSMCPNLEMQPSS